MSRGFLRYGVCSLLFLLWVSTSVAVQPYVPERSDPVLEKWRWRSYKQLKGQHLRHMIQDREGRMWFGVRNGVRVYDGVNWVSYGSADGIAGEHVRSLCVTPDSSIYVGTEMGISRFREGSWELVFPTQEGCPWQIWDLEAAPNNTVWAATWAGALHIRPGGIRLYATAATSDTLGSVAPDAELVSIPGECVAQVENMRYASNTAWGLSGSAPKSYEITTRDGTEKLDFGVARLRAKRNDPPGFGTVMQVLPANRVQGDRVRMAGRVRSEDVEGWAGLWLRVDGQDTTLAFENMENRPIRGTTDWRNYTIDLGVPPGAKQIAFGVLLEGSGAVLIDEIRIESSGRGREVAESQTQKDTLYDVVLRDDFEEPMRYPIVSVFDICVESSGSIWLGLMGGELLRCERGAGSDKVPDVWRIYTRRHGLDTAESPVVYEGKDKSIWAICASKHGGVNRFDGKTWESFRLSDIRGTDFTFSILQTKDGTLWIGGARKLHALRGNTWTVYDSRDLPVPQGYMTDMVESDDGALWIACLGHEAVRLDISESNSRTLCGLQFQFADTSGKEWFLTEDGRAISHLGDNWLQYDRSDGLMDSPSVLLQDSTGVVWAGGSDDSTAATARFDGTRWHTQMHPTLSWSVLGRLAFVSDDGAVWFGGHPEPIPGREGRYTGGFLQFDGQQWITHLRPGRVYPYGIGQMGDGSIWIGGLRGLLQFDGKTWRNGLVGVGAPKQGPHLLYCAPTGELWLGTRSVIYRFDGHEWTRFTEDDGLAPGITRSIGQSEDGSVWVASFNRLSRYDGQTWVSYPKLIAGNNFIQKHGLRVSDGNAIWVTYRHRDRALRTTRYQPDDRPPVTEITLGPRQVAYPGNVAIEWDAVDPLDQTVASELRYSSRLDGGPWSPFERRTSSLLVDLDIGDHVFEVKARDLDLNEDPTPAAARFTVLPPLWRRTWFLGGLLALVGIGATQTVRLLLRGRALRVANDALIARSTELEREIDERARIERDHARLDTQLQELQYRYQLRLCLSKSSTVEETISCVGQLVAEALSPTRGEGVRADFDSRSYEFGTYEANGKHLYERPLMVGGKKRGDFAVCSSNFLSYEQEHLLLDETVGQLNQVLEARDLETQLLQSSRLVALGELAAGVAHELNQPLSVVSTTAGDIRDRLTEGLELTGEQLDRMMADLLAVVERMDETVDHLRVFSRDSAQQPPVPFSVNDSATDALRLIRTQLDNHGIDLQTDLADGLPDVSGHPHQVEQVILNLLSNARDALDEKEGRLQEHGEAPKAWRKRLSLATRLENSTPGEVAIEISDNGTGVPEDLRSQIFEPFYTTKGSEKGTGLGLSISHAIIRRHGGRILCDGRDGEGATFTVLLPAAREA